MAVVVIVVIVVLIAFAAAVWLRSRKHPADAVDSFRRQIDALSSDARRPTIEQVRGEQEAGDDEPDEEEGGDGA